ncbi:MAG: hypothetical protein V1913_10750 [Fibrobacterota bacterium]
MLSRVLLSSVLLIFLSAPLFSQLDLKQKAQLVGIQVDEKPGVTEKEKLTDISFIFVDKPSAYYHNFKDGLLVVDFYDAQLGEEKLPDITQAPFTGSTIAIDKIDVNKDIEGMQPLFKDIVRVTLPVQQGLDIDFTMSDDFNVVTLATVWTAGGKLGEKSRKTGKKSYKWMWITGGVVGVTTGTVLYFFLSNQDGTDNNDKGPGEWDPAAPALPPQP